MKGGFEAHLDAKSFLSLDRLGLDELVNGDLCLRLLPLGQDLLCLSLFFCEFNWFWPQEAANFFQKQAEHYRRCHCENIDNDRQTDNYFMIGITSLSEREQTQRCERHFHNSLQSLHQNQQIFLDGKALFEALRMRRTIWLLLIVVCLFLYGQLCVFLFVNFCIRVLHFFSLRIGSFASLLVDHGNCGYLAIFLVAFLLEVAFFCRGRIEVMVTLEQGLNLEGEDDDRRVECECQEDNYDERKKGGCRRNILYKYQSNKDRKLHACAYHACPHFPENGLQLLFHYTIQSKRFRFNLTDPFDVFADGSDMALPVLILYLFFLSGKADLLLLDLSGCRILVCLRYVLSLVHRYRIKFENQYQNLISSSIIPHPLYRSPNQCLKLHFCSHPISKIETGNQQFHFYRLTDGGAGQASVSFQINSKNCDFVYKSGEICLNGPHTCHWLDVALQEALVQKKYIFDAAKQNDQTFGIF